MNSLPSPKKGVLTHELAGQVIVYDPADDRIHLLDGTTGTVFGLLQSGFGSQKDLSAELAGRLKIEMNDDLVALAIRELDEVGLLEEEAQPRERTNRRELVKKLAAAGVAGVLVPAVATLSATRAYAQSLVGLGGACTMDNNCASGKCYDAHSCAFDNTCAPASCGVKDTFCSNATMTDVCDSTCCMSLCKENKCN